MGRLVLQPAGRMPTRRDARVTEPPAMHRIPADTVPRATADIDPRTLHYGTFYGVQEPETDRPLLLVHGNCQAESLRIMLTGADVEAVRIPPVHELTAADVPHLQRLLRRTAILVSQPIHDDYHALPLGSRQLAALLPPGARSATVPVVRFAGLYPLHAIVRPPENPSLSPPLVAYHDLLTLVTADHLRRGIDPPSLAPPTATQVHEIAAASREALATRERAHGSVRASDLFDAPGFDLMRTINHPGNSIFTSLAERVFAAVGIDAVPFDPQRPILTSVHAPRSAAVIRAFDLDDEPRTHWTVEGVDIEDDEVRRAHLDWYAERPGVVDAGLSRHAAALRTLGLA